MPPSQRLASRRGSTSTGPIDGLAATPATEEWRRFFAAADTSSTTSKGARWARKTVEPQGLTLQGLATVRSDRAFAAAINDISGPTIIELAAGSAGGFSFAAPILVVTPHPLILRSAPRPAPKTKGDRGSPPPPAAASEGEPEASVQDPASAAEAEEPAASTKTLLSLVPVAGGGSSSHRIDARPVLVVTERARVVVDGLDIRGAVHVTSRAEAELVRCLVTLDSPQIPDNAAHGTVASKPSRKEAAVLISGPAAVRQCRISGGSYGILVAPPRRMLIRISDTAVSDSAVGILLDGPSCPRVEGCAVTCCRVAGIVAGGCGRCSSISGNTISGCLGFGMVVEAASAARVHANTVSGCSGGASLICGNARPVFDSNVLSGAGVCAVPLIAVTQQATADVFDNTLSVKAAPAEGSGQVAAAVVVNETADCVLHRNAFSVADDVAFTSADGPSASPDASDDDQPVAWRPAAAVDGSASIDCSANTFGPGCVTGGAPTVAFSDFAMAKLRMPRPPSEPSEGEGSATEQPAVACSSGMFSSAKLATVMQSFADVEFRRLATAGLFSSPRKPTPAEDVPQPWTQLSTMTKARVETASPILVNRRSSSAATHRTPSPAPMHQQQPLPPRGPTPPPRAFEEASEDRACEDGATLARPVSPEDQGGIRFVLAAPDGDGDDDGDGRPIDSRASTGRPPTADRSSSRAANGTPQASPRARQQPQRPQSAGNRRSESNQRSQRHAPQRPATAMASSGRTRKHGSVMADNRREDPAYEAARGRQARPFSADGAGREQTARRGGGGGGGGGAAYRETYTPREESMMMRIAQLERQVAVAKRREADVAVAGGSRQHQHQHHDPRSASAASHGSQRSRTPRDPSPRNHEPFSEGSRVVRVGRYTWDDESRKAFLRGESPLAGVRFVAAPPPQAPPITERLHDQWLKDRKEDSERVNSAMAAAQRSKSGRRLTKDDQKESVGRLYYGSLQTAKETAARLNERYLSKGRRGGAPVQPKPKSKDAEMDEIERCCRIADRLDEYRKTATERRLKLEAEVLVEPWRERVKRRPKDAVERFCASLYKSHRDVAAAQQAATQLDTDLDLEGIATRMSSRTRERDQRVRESLRRGASAKPPPKRTKDQTEAYCSSLYLSHKNAMVANVAADALGPGARIGRVADNGAPRPWDPHAQRAASKVPRPPPRVPPTAAIRVPDDDADDADGVPAAAGRGDDDALIEHVPADAAEASAARPNEADSEPSSLSATV